MSNVFRLQCLPLCHGFQVISHDVQSTEDDGANYCRKSDSKVLGLISQYVVRAQQKKIQFNMNRRLHSNRMHTARPLTVSPSMLWGDAWSGGRSGPKGCLPGPGGGCLPGPGGACLVPGGAWSWGVPAWSRGWYPSMH